MENHVPIIAKKVWKMVRVVFFMLRRGISKGKLMMDLNILLKRRGKLAGKAIANLMMFHHPHPPPPQQFSASRGEYEFSCTNTPNNFFPIRGKRHNHHNFFTCAHAPPTLDDNDSSAVTMNNAVKAVLEMLTNNNNNSSEAAMVAAEASPALPGFGRSPMVRQLRVTDSPFPLRDEDDNHQVDKAAEDFIKRFYKELRKQD